MSASRQRRRINTTFALLLQRDQDDITSPPSTPVGQQPSRWRGCHPPDPGLSSVRMIISVSLLWGFLTATGSWHVSPHLPAEFQLRWTGRKSQNT